MKKSISGPKQTNKSAQPSVTGFIYGLFTASARIKETETVLDQSAAERQEAIERLDRSISQSEKQIMETDCEITEREQKKALNTSSKTMTNSITPK